MMTGICVIVHNFNSLVKGVQREKYQKLFPLSRGQLIADVRHKKPENPTNRWKDDWDERKLKITSKVSPNFTLTWLKQWTDEECVGNNGNYKKKQQQNQIKVCHKFPNAEENRYEVAHREDQEKLQQIN